MNETRTFYLVTGMSGAGKSTVLNVLEDSGFYCVDNLPAGLFDKFFELLVEAAQSNEARQKVALAVDLRSGAHFNNITDSLKILSIHQIPYRMIFLNCEDQVLVRRFKETRRRHPLYKGNLLEAIQKERKLLTELHANAEVVIDTTEMKTRELSQKVIQLLQTDESDTKLVISLYSFGFKHGIPKDADLVLDVRFMDNPFYKEGLKEKSGMDQEVKDFIFSNPQSLGYLEKIESFLKDMVPAYLQEGRKSLHIAIGCTGGQHRSVATVEYLSRSLGELPDVFLASHHRDCK